MDAFTELVNTAQLEAHLNDPTWVIVDCRFELTQPAWGEAEYHKGHILGAIYAHLDRDLSSPVTLTTGRHPLPAKEVFTQKLSSWGIDHTRQVVVYDSAGGGFASRLWWLLNYYGHTAVALLDGGFARWSAENRPVQTARPTPHATHFVPDFDEFLVVSAEEVERFGRDPGYLLIDARAPVRFRGEQEPIDPVAGHIPGAVNRFHGDNLDPNGSVLPVSELRQQFKLLVKDVVPEHVIVYCGSGVTSCHHVLAMRMAGLGTPRLYPGSWSEWIRDPSRPVASFKE